MVFTQLEDEANDLVAALKVGLVAVDHGVASMINVPPGCFGRPVALDIEWRVLFTRQHNSTSAQLKERRTAVVQVADTKGIILVLQVFVMESTCW